MLLVISYYLLQKEKKKHSVFFIPEPFRTGLLQPKTLKKKIVVLNNLILII